MPNEQRYDFIIIGGGIFGAYAALYVAGKGYRVCILEKEQELLRKASIVNQARLHSGYHYPRSVATAMMSDDNKARFTAEHRPFINFAFEKYYAIDRFGSFTDSLQFERFCDYINIRCERLKEHPLFNFNRIEALYATTEYTFDPLLIAQHYREQLAAHPGISVYRGQRICSAAAVGSAWEMEVEDLHTGGRSTYTGTQVINATYAGSNAINRLFGVRDINLMHEISEMAFVTSPALAGVGLTVMDGPFGSIMPYGLSGLHSLSSVAYTHHKVSYDNLPTFDCQLVNRACQPHFTANCNGCPARPASNQHKMMAQMMHYFSDKVALDYYTSLFTIKSKLKANYIDDGRPTEISVLHDSPRFYCVFAGKINSIYEIEKMI